MKREWFTKGIFVGAGITAGIVGSLAIAVTVGTVKTWTTGETLTAADLNSTVGALKTAVEGITSSQWTTGTGGAISYSGGNIGIGTTSPIGNLHVAGSTNVYETVENTGTGYSRLWFMRNGSFVGSIGVNNAGVFGLSHDSGSDKATPDISINSTGNVGIGTTGPESSLVVAGGLNGAPTSNGVHIGTALSGTSAQIQLLGTHATVPALIDFAASASTDANFRIVSVGSGRLDIGAGTTPTGMSITSAGNVGIGTTSPMHPLHVRTSASGTQDLLSLHQESNVTGNAWGIDFKRKTVSGNGLVSKAYVRAVQEGGYATGLSFGTSAALDDTGAIDSFVVKSNGNVGIGTTTPGYPLTMGSGAYVTTGGVWTNASSREVKENIRDLSADEALETVMALEPQKFSYRSEQGSCPRSDGATDAGIKPAPTKATDSSSGSRRLQPASCTPEQYVGFIAEDVPALVATNDRKGLSSMDLVAVLTKVVQEQQARIEKLERDLESPR